MSVETAPDKTVRPAEGDPVDENKLASLTEAIRSEPNNPTAHCELGRQLFQLGRFEHAAASFRDAICLNPLLWSAHHELGRCLVKLGKKAEAIAAYEEALQIKPDAAAIHNNLGILFEETKKYPAAIQSFRRSLRLDPNCSDTHSNMGVALAGLGKLEEAAQSYREALRLAPESCQAHNNLGNALRSLGNLKDSQVHLEQAIRLTPGYAEAHNNLGITHLQMGNPALAVTCYSRALELKPEYPEARLNRALALLGQGNLEQGWREYEFRWHGNGMQKRHTAQPEWAGEPHPDGAVLLCAEQGLGDTMQFVRYASLVKERVGKVIVEAQPALINLLKTCPGISQLVAQGKPLPAFAAHCPLMSLPRVLQTRLETIPAPIPYLFPEPDRVARWQEVLRSLPGFRVGICWQGNPDFRGDRQRSLPLRLFAPLAAIPGVTLISLQKGDGSGQIQEVSQHFRVEPLPGLDDFADTAAVMSRLDLVVTCDTAPAHLAGALGVPVWVLLPASCDWRWLRQRDDSPWYPSMRLFRQQDQGDWTPVLEKVAQALAVRVQEQKRLSVPVVIGKETLPSESSDPEAIYRRGLDYLKQGHWALGEPLLRDFLRCQPTHAGAQHNLGVALASLKKWSEAVAVFEELLKREPKMAVAHNNLGLAFLDWGKPKQAEPAFRKAASLNASSADFSNNLGVALARQNRLEEAVACYRQSLLHRPNYAEAHSNLGSALRLLGQLDDALHHCERACQLAGDYAESHFNRGLVHRDLGDLANALLCYHRALEIKPEHADVRVHRAEAWLAQGDFPRGWPELEWRARLPQSPRRSFSVPAWDGSALAGRRILIHAEQGLGNTLHFIRYTPLVQERGGRVVLEVPRELIGLLSDCPGIDQLVARGMPLPECVTHCPMLSLPFRLRTGLDSIPAPIPYLAVHPRRVAKWKNRLQALTGFKVGIAWQGDPAYPGDHGRSLPLEQFAPLAQVAKLQLISLQKGPGSEQVGRLKSGFTVHELPGLDEDGNAFMDTAAVMNLLDLVVTSDTAVAHLAGALGIRVWVVLPNAADWRWLRGRDDSPWYPSMRLFRQDKPGDWPGVFQRLSAALRLEMQKTQQKPESTQGRPVPDSKADESYQRGLHLLTQNQWAEGETCLREVLRLQPQRWGAYVNLGVALARQKKFQDAIACFERYVEAQPQSVEGFNNLGLACLELSRVPEAEKAFGEAARLQPGNADYHNNLGVCRMRQGKHDEAIAAFQQAIQLEPERISTVLNLGNAFRTKKDFPKAIHYYTEASRLHPHDAGTLCNIGMAYSELRDRAKAAEYYRKAVELDPDFSDAQNNLGVALADLNDLPGAEFHLQEAIRIRPEHGETHRNLGIIQLMAGKFPQGLAEYEWRRKVTETHATSCPRWDGSPLAGRTLLLHPEQGLGDVLQFIRYARLAKQTGGRVIFECPKVLTSLLRDQPGIDQLVPQGSSLPSVDVAAPLLSLPFLFGTTLETIPAQVPYLQGNPERVARWRVALRHLGGFKVAIAWQGSPKYAGDFQRSIPLNYFAGLAEIPRVQLISLQKDFGTEQLGRAAQQFVPMDLSRQIDQDGQAFVDSAAIMQLVDLVITSDTALAHLAGAMGVPVWLVLHFAADWRWLRNRDDSPWYPTMRLFRQQTAGDWAGVFQRVADALRERSQEGQGQRPGKDAAARDRHVVLNDWGRRSPVPWGQVLKDVSFAATSEPNDARMFFQDPIFTGEGTYQAVVAAADAGGGSLPAIDSFMVAVMDATPTIADIDSLMVRPGAIVHAGKIPDPLVRPASTVLDPVFAGRESILDGDLNGALDAALLDIISGEAPADPETSSRWPGQRYSAGPDESRLN